MDEMFIKLRTKLMKNLISKLLCKAIKSKTGYKIDIQFKDLEAEINNGEIIINANLEVKMDEHEFVKTLKSEDLD